MSERRFSCVAIVPAGGSGARMGASVPKQYLEIDGVSVLEHTLRALASVHAIEQIYLVAQADDVVAPQIVERAGLQRLRLLACAGVTRAQTVTQALNAMRTELLRDASVLVHDAARPCVTPASIERLIAATREEAAGGLLALPITDTVKRSDHQGEYVETVPRDGLWRAQTPQLFPYETLSHALRASPDVTDESQAIEALGLRPKLVLGETTNIKITYPEDLALAAFFLRERATTKDLRTT
jgi:2-C-methyl-D-erythritol 4-phosphate cytidylyltransferase